jgi:hypothetical protein
LNFTIVVFVVCTVGAVVLVIRRKRIKDRIIEKYGELAKKLEIHGIPYGGIKVKEVPSYMDWGKLGEIYSECYKSANGNHAATIFEKLAKIADRSDPDAFIVASVVAIVYVLSNIRDMRETCGDLLQEE